MFAPHIAHEPGAMQSHVPYTALLDLIAEEPNTAPRLR